MNLEDKLKSELQLFGTAQLKVNAITQKEIIKRYNAYEDLVQKSYNLIATLHEQLPYDSTQNEDIIFDVKELADLLNELKPELETQILELDEQ